MFIKSESLNLQDKMFVYCVVSVACRSASCLSRTGFPNVAGFHSMLKYNDETIQLNLLIEK